MGVYSYGELENMGVHRLFAIREVHKKDLNMYLSSEPYENRERDISECQQNIKILDEVIEHKSK
ncbi:hypothetical protein M5X00_26360 [Paenibacillus alvei]|uniref:hypothetical protein n=1 Tax=Paenibacillus alvei TaxID=44250 RepID=UPI00227DEDDA|nr:hypothetical protein [Paenibacillus alvei]MCY9757756.1 hypothetical protein [Paenibacillus alvei]